MLPEWKQHQLTAKSLPAERLVEGFVRKNVENKEAQ